MDFMNKISDGRKRVSKLREEARKIADSLPQLRQDFIREQAEKMLRIPVWAFRTPAQFGLRWNFDLWGWRNAANCGVFGDNRNSDIAKLISKRESDGLEANRLLEQCRKADIAILEYVSRNYPENVYRLFSIDYTSLGRAKSEEEFLMSLVREA